MPALTWLPAVLRGAGLTVHVVDGWQSRTNRTYPVSAMDPRNIVCHATASPRGTTDAQEISVLLNGSNTAPPPISQLYLGKQGHWWVVAAGVCNHIGSANVGGYTGNKYAIGIEASNNNSTEPWPAAQYYSYALGVAAICHHMGWNHTHVYGHKEVSSTGKTDPTFSMPTFRSNVATYLEDLMVMTEARWQWLASRVHGTYQMLATGVNGSALTSWQQNTTALLQQIAEQTRAAAEGNADPDALRAIAEQANTAATELRNLSLDTELPAADEYAPPADAADVQPERDDDDDDD